MVSIAFEKPSLCVQICWWGGAASVMVVQWVTASIAINACHNVFHRCRLVFFRSSIHLPGGKTSFLLTSLQASVSIASPAWAIVGEVLPPLNVDIHHVPFAEVLEGKNMLSYCQWPVTRTEQPSESAYPVNMPRPLTMQYIPVLSKKTVIIKLRISAKITLLLEVNAHY